MYNINMDRFKITDRLLLALIVFEDVFDTVIGGGSRAYHAKKLFLYTPPGYKGSALSIALRRLKKKNELSKIEYENEKFVKLTKEGVSKAKEIWPIIFWQQQKWDKLWRMVIFDIEEKYRTKRILLQRMLKSLGFGQLQRSVYISCYDVLDEIYQFVKKTGLDKDVFVLVNKQTYIKDFNQLIERIWGIEEINRRYKKLYKRLKAGSVNDLFMQKVINSYLEIVKDDPHLPVELLPKLWYGFKIKKWIKQKGKRHIK